MRATTIHFVYPHGTRISCPDAIGRNVSSQLRHKYNVVLYNWDEIGIINPNSNDVLLGHPHPAPWTIFRRSAKQIGWKRIIAFSPYNHSVHQMAFFNNDIKYCDLYLAITGNYWFDSIDRSDFWHWQPKMIHVDLAVDRNDFPIIKTNFNEPGERQFVYIGHTGKAKNTQYLSKIANRMPNTAFSWIGRGKRGINGLEPLGFQDFRSKQGQDTVANHDFMITVGNVDANPATILEAMAWGLIPVCTPQSGYYGYPSIINIPLDDVDQAVEILNTLQYTPEITLKEMQSKNWDLLDRHFNWDRVVRQIIDAIESGDSFPVGRTTYYHRLRLSIAALCSFNSALRPRNFVRFWMNTLKKRK